MAQNLGYPFKLYLTGNPAAPGAPRFSRMAATGSVSYQHGGTWPEHEGGSADLWKYVPATIPAYGMAHDLALVHTQRLITTAFPSGNGVPLEFGYPRPKWEHIFAMPLCTFSIRLDGSTSTLRYDEVMTQHWGTNGYWVTGCQHIAGMSTWSGYSTFFNADYVYGPGYIATYPRYAYVWRPSTQAVVGMLWTADLDQDAYGGYYKGVGLWFSEGGRVSTNYPLCYTAGSIDPAISQCVNSGNVSGIQAGDQYVQEWWGTRYWGDQWGFFTAYTDCTTGVNDFYHTWDIPVGGTFDMAGSVGNTDATDMRPWAGVVPYGAFGVIEYVARPVDVTVGF